MEYIEAENRNNFDNEKIYAKKYFNLVNNIIIAIDKQERVILINKKGFETLGYTQDEILYKNWFDIFVNENERERVRLNHKSLISGERELTEYTEYEEYPILTKNGNNRIIAWRISLVKDNNETPLYAVYSGEDISDRLSAEENLCWELEVNKSIAEISQALISNISIDDISQIVSNHAKSLTQSIFSFAGYIDSQTKNLIIPEKYKENLSSEELEIIHKTFNDLYNSLNENQITVLRTVSDAEKDNKNSDSINHLSIPVIIEDNIAGIIFISNQNRNFNERDAALLERFASIYSIAIQKFRIEQEKQKLRTQLVQSEKMAAIGQLAGGVAHELNNPLTGALGLTQILMREYSKDASLLKDLQKIDSLIIRCKNIIQALLNYSRRESHELKKININDVVENAILLVGHQIDKCNITIVKDLEQNPHPILGNQQPLEQVMINLMTNARDAMPNGGTLTLSTKNKDNEIEIRVSDTGTGIPQDILEKIFDPFFTTKPQGKGTGLGLSICKGIIDTHKGQIYAETQVGKGSTFIITLPTVKEY